jgi:hypothetical protein
MILRIRVFRDNCMLLDEWLPTFQGTQNFHIQASSSLSRMDHATVRSLILVYNLFRLCITYIIIRTCAEMQLLISVYIHFISLVQLRENLRRNKFVAVT